MHVGTVFAVALSSFSFLSHLLSVALLQQSRPWLPVPVASCIVICPRGFSFFLFCNYIATWITCNRGAANSQNNKINIYDPGLAHLVGLKTIWKANRNVLPLQLTTHQLTGPYPHIPCPQHPPPSIDCSDPPLRSPSRRKHALDLPYPGSIQSVRLLEHPRPNHRREACEWAYDCKHNNRPINYP